MIAIDEENLIEEYHKNRNGSLSLASNNGTTHTEAEAPYECPYGDDIAEEHLAPPVEVAEVGLESAIIDVVSRAYLSSVAEASDVHHDEACEGQAAVDVEGAADAHKAHVEGEALDHADHGGGEIDLKHELPEVGLVYRLCETLLEGYAGYVGFNVKKVDTEDNREDYAAAEVAACRTFLFVLS